MKSDESISCEDLSSVLERVSAQYALEIQKTQLQIQRLAQADDATVIAFPGTLPSQHQPDVLLRPRRAA